MSLSEAVKDESRSRRWYVIRVDVNAHPEVLNGAPTFEEDARQVARDEKAKNPGAAVYVARVVARADVEVSTKLSELA